MWGSRVRRRQAASPRLVAVAEPPDLLQPDVDGVDAGRPLADKAVYSACYAPSVSMYFDQHGDVRACCHNLTAVLGNVALSTVREIWEGDGVRDLRAALAQRDLSRGCGVCEWQGRDETNRSTFARGYDGFAVESAQPEWPKQIEFAISNSCNLQCVMCTGWNSSAIRTHREHLPPIDNPYGDRFFDEIAEFLPHLERVILLGGEPFLSSHFLRLLDMIAELDDPPRVTVITNGTQWTPRVQRICERVPVDFQLSLDAARPDTFAAIRIGADFDEVIGNLAHFRTYAERHGTTVSIGFCLMPDNALEFVEVLELAEAHGLDEVHVNDVKFPPKYSPYHLPADELAALLDRLDEQEAQVAALARFGDVWHTQRSLLRTHLATITDETDTAVVPWTVPWDVEGEACVRCRDELTQWSGARPTFVRGDAAFNLAELDGPIAELVDEARLAGGGLPLTALLDLIGQRFDARMSPTASTSGEPNEVSFEGIRGDEVVVELRSFMFTDDSDLVAWVAWREV